MITALATGLGALPLLFVTHVNKWWLGICNGIASGLMLGASHGLITEGLDYGVPRVVTGIITGILFMTVTYKLLNRRNDLHIGALEGANALKALMIVGVMTFHSIAEGGWCRGIFRRRRSTRGTYNHCDSHPQHPRGTCHQPGSGTTGNKCS